MTLHFIVGIDTYSNWPTPDWRCAFPRLRWGWDGSHGAFSVGVTLWRWALWVSVTPWGVYQWQVRLKQ